jgi:hypothetical protein
MNGERRPSIFKKRNRSTRMVMMSGTIAKIPPKKYLRNTVFSFALKDMPPLPNIRCF